MRTTLLPDPDVAALLRRARRQRKPKREHRRSAAEPISPTSTQPLVSAEDVAGPEWAEWYRLTPEERFRESEKLWRTYLALGGSLDPEPDTQSPFFDPGEERPRAPHGRTGLRVVRRGRV